MIALDTQQWWIQAVFGLGHCDAKQHQSYWMFHDIWDLEMWGNRGFWRVLFLFFIHNSVHDAALCRDTTSSKWTELTWIRLMIPAQEFMMSRGIILVFCFCSMPLKKDSLVVLIWIFEWWLSNLRWNLVCLNFNWKPIATAGTCIIIMIAFWLSSSELTPFAQEHWGHPLWV